MFLRSRISANTCGWRLARHADAGFATSARSARRNGLAALLVADGDRNGRLRFAKSALWPRPRARRAPCCPARWSREFDVGGGVFVAAIDFGVVRQVAQLHAAIATSAPACPRSRGRSRSRTACRRRRRACRRETNRRCGRSVWPGVSITLADNVPTLTLSPSRTVSSTAGIFDASAAGATTRHLYLSLSALMPSV